jgi:hypothetical protein
VLTVSDWKAVKGVRFFRLATIEMEDATIEGGGELRITGLEVNTVEPERFALPEEVVALKNAAPAADEEIRLEDLSAEQQAQASAMIAEGTRSPGTDEISAMIQGMEGSLNLMPPDQQRMFRYVVQELRRELERRGG